MAPAVKAKAPEEGKAKDKSEKSGKDAKVAKAPKVAKPGKDAKAVKAATKDAKSPKEKRTGKDGKDSKLKGVKRGKIQKKRATAKLSSGVYVFGRSRLISKNGKFRVVPKRKEKAKKPSKPTRIIKTIGGEKNGETRLVLVKKRKNYYPTAKRIRRHPTKKSSSKPKVYTRRTLRPGKICILLAGRHKGKRVVLLKVLKSGLLLVTGPFKINGCPLRRVSQNYVIATRTKLDLSDVTVPEHITDAYFKRNKQKSTKKEDGNIFVTVVEEYSVSDKRKTDQKLVDDEVMKAIKKHPEKTLMRKYLSSMFGLKKTQFPHRMKF